MLECNDKHDIQLQYSTTAWMNNHWTPSSLLTCASLPVTRAGIIHNQSIDSWMVKGLMPIPPVKALPIFTWNNQLLLNCKTHLPLFPYNYVIYVYHCIFFVYIMFIVACSFITFIIAFLNILSILVYTTRKEGYPESSVKHMRFTLEVPDRLSIYPDRG